DDIGDMHNIANTMNVAISGSATYIPVGAGGNPGNIYDPAHKDNYSINGVADDYSIYQYMLICSNSNGAAATAPVTSAGADRTISLPARELQLKGSALPAAGSFLVSAVWSQTDGAPAALESDSLSANVSGLAEGVYAFSLTTRDNNGLSASSRVTITVNAAAKHPIGAQSGENDASVVPGEKLTTYPNPARDVLTVNWESGYQGKADVMIFDLTGRSLQTAPVMKEGAVFTGPVTVSALKPGAYFLKILLQNGKTITEKFIKQ
ncbi:MAG TPA: T9SS type A sorting domain-containing protein, partial [Puia sp.]|nr:T9SS type A sorting domain-containing protein [Puia sp.]